MIQKNVNEEKLREFCNADADADADANADADLPMP